MQARLKLLLAVCIFLASSVFSQTSDKTSLATVAGQPIYEGDLAPYLQSQLRQLRSQEYELKTRILEGVINQKLVEAEAKQKGLSSEGKYDGKVRLAYRDFPLQQIHPQAQMAAEASRCAAEQGKFWEYHDLLFANFGKLDKAALLEHARGLPLDEGRFESCLSSGKYKAEMQREGREGTAAGVNGTPAFFVNGVFLNGAQPAAAFEKVIDEELAAAERRGSSSR